ncbi:GABA transporter 1-like [Oryza brachyantha]|uniref:Amino acid transporter transmembrane domain-containing protein n=1 Tax=Oryza brachyantha TaxID=4533 RepID=J3N2M9_ORYBR|nr:GABA transporter 1-like [Oryza brachyantha]
MSPARGSSPEVGGADAEKLADGGERGRGTWRHAAFHVATTIATPAAYAPLPFALASLGWPLGVCSLVIGTLVTWCSSLVVASLWQWNGDKHTSYRHLANSIFGPWGYWYVSFFQQVASIGNNIAIQIAAGSSLKAVYKHYHTADDGDMTLQQFIILFGAFELLLSQLPDIHSLRWVNAVCTASTIGFAGTAIGVTIYDGHRIDRKDVGYSLQGSTASKIFRAFNALGTIAFSFGDAMLPEIQSSLREPVRMNMYKGVSTAYSIIVMSYWTLAFSGYWAFGSGVQPYILSSLTVPRWTIVMTNLFAVIQITGCFQIYCRPTFAQFEQQVQAKDAGYKARLWRLMYTSAYMVVITLISAAMPFFGDFVSICGAVGFTPLDFVLPALAFLKAGRLPESPVLRAPAKAIASAVAVLFSVVGALACIGAVRAIALDVKTYKFFHDM